MEKAILLLNLAATFFLSGIIWLIQLVQYPFFAEVGAENFRKYHAAHTFWITPVVAPPMIIELVTSVLLVFYPLPQIDFRLVLGGLGLTLIIWASTFFVQVPLHDKLAGGFDSDAHRLLVNTNWIRAVAWSLRGIIVFYFAWQMFSSRS
jgi:hypothetical protein